MTKRKEKDMTQAHTPGEWHVNAIRDGRIIGDETAEGWEKLHINGPNNTIARVYHGPDARRIVSCVNAFEGLDELARTSALPASVLANARLMAAAPELLEACIAVAGVYQDAGDDVPLFVRRCRAAIAKARGA